MLHKIIWETNFWETLSKEQSTRTTGGYRPPAAHPTRPGSHSTPTRSPSLRVHRGPSHTRTTSLRSGRRKPVRGEGGSQPPVTQGLPTRRRRTRSIDTPAQRTLFGSRDPSHRLELPRWSRRGLGCRCVLRGRVTRDPRTCSQERSPSFAQREARTPRLSAPTLFTQHLHPLRPPGPSRSPHSRYGGSISLDL